MINTCETKRLIREIYAMEDNLLRTKDAAQQNAIVSILAEKRRRLHKMKYSQYR